VALFDAWGLKHRNEFYVKISFLTRFVLEDLVGILQVPVS